jgi:hypothetical protein
MTRDLNDSSSSAEREEPPFLFGLIGQVINRSTALVRATLQSIDQRVLMKLWGGGALAIFVLVAGASIASSPGLAGIAQGLFAGFFLALLFAVGFGALLLSARRSREPKAAAVIPAATELNARLAPTVRELNAMRGDFIAQVKARSVTRIPLGTAIAIALWALAQRGDDPPGVFGFFLFVILGALGGEVWAAHKPEREYRRIYKERVLPQIAAGVGNLTYRAASKDRVAKFGAERVLPQYDTLQADDEIAGTYDGLAVEIIEVRLKKRQNKKSRVVFDGLLIGITLPRSLTGTTVIMTDGGAWENFKTRWRGGALEPVRLEHAEFEQNYEVYSTDQIEARALLTPAFMERFMALATASGFSLPGGMAEGNMLVVALPKRFGAGDLFEPPAYWKPAGGQELVRLENDIRVVLEMADTVIHLDFWAAGRQRDAAQARQQATTAVSRTL